jgi:putative two-component system response regulator
MELQDHPRILIVDDEADNRALLRRILAPLGYLVTEAADGEEALEALKTSLPDAVLLDVSMPKLDGYAVCKTMKGDPRTKLIPVIMLTALSRRSDRLQGLALGVDEFLTKPFDVTELTVRVRALVSLKRYTDELENASNVLQAMARVIQKRDQQTGDHCGRVGDLAVKVAMSMGLDDSELKNLRLGGLLHDLGKIAIPDAILSKPGRLTAEEFEIIKSHPIEGATLVEPMGIMRGALPLIRHHHERLDGSGYPDGLKGEQIPIAVRILTVSDIYDVLSSRRPYKEPLAKEASLNILREEADKGWWDKNVIEILAKIAD